MTVRKFILTVCLLISPASQAKNHNAIFDSVIVGAGIAGLSTAEQLQQAHKRVLLLEASDRAGGRIKTIYSNKKTPLDLGASWIHGIEHNPITHLVPNKDLIINSYSDNEVQSMLTDFAMYNPSGKLLEKSIQEKYIKRIRQIELALLQSNRNQSIEAVYKQFIKNHQISVVEQQWLIYMLNNIYTYEYGADLNNVGYSMERLYNESEVYGDNALIKPGYEWILKPLLQQAPIRYNMAVTTIDYTKNIIKVCAASSCYLARSVVITVPLGVLKAKKIKFVPPLPNDKQKAIQKIAMGNYEKTFLIFNKAFWQKDLQKEWLGILPRDKNNAFNIFNLYKYSKEPILIAFSSGRFAKKMAQQDFTKWVMKKMRIIYGDNIPDPIEVYRTHWASDPNYMGSYSYLPVGSSLKWIRALAKPVNKKIFFAGEATSLTDMATTNGAYQTGRRAAAQVLKTLKRS